MFVPFSPLISPPPLSPSSPLPPTDYDRHLLNKGRHWQCYNRLGAQTAEDRRG